MLRHMAPTDLPEGVSPVGVTLPPRGGRRRWVRLLVALTSSTALLGTVALVAAAAIVPPIGARRAARVAAEQEVMAQLAPNERVLARTFASQRRWTDMGRESFGVVVATSEQLLFVGAPPTPMLRPREDGPAELLVERYPYAAVFTVEPRTRFGGYQRSLVLRTPTTTVHFFVEGRDWASALRVLQVSGAAR